jgi:hypothetical protein
MQYTSNWHKEENLSSGSDKNSMLVDVVKFISPTKNASDTSSESFDLNQFNSIFFSFNSSAIDISMSSAAYTMRIYKEW